MRRGLVTIICAVLALTLGACASGARSDFGLNQRDAAIPVGFPNVRFSVEDEVSAQSIERQLNEGVPRGADGRFDLIALSGVGRTAPSPPG